MVGREKVEGEVGRSGAPAATSGQPTASPSTRRNLGVVIAVVVLVGVVAYGVQAIIRAAGWVTPISGVLVVLVALTTGVVGLLVANRELLDGHLPRPALVVAGVAMVILASAAWLLADDPLVYRGELGGSARTIEYPITVQDGDRLVVALETSRGLEADLRLMRGTWGYQAVEREDGIRVVDETVHEGVWIARVVALDDTSGSYTLGVEVDPGLAFTIGDSREEDLVDARDSTGYRFRVDRRQPVYVGVTPVDDMEVAVAVRRGGFGAVLVQKKGDSWAAYRTLEAGNYVVIVDSPSGHVGRYRVDILPEAPGQTVVEATPGPRDVLTVPAGLVGMAQEDAEEALAEAEFSYGVWTVCSSSVPAGFVRQVVREDPEAGEIAVVDRRGLVATEQRLPADTQLIVKVSTGEPCSDP